MTGILVAAAIVGGVGLFIGVFLGVSQKQFAVEVDEREEAILGVLPGTASTGQQLWRLWICGLLGSCGGDCEGRSSGQRLSGRRSSGCRKGRSNHGTGSR